MSFYLYERRSAKGSHFRNLKSLQQNLQMIKTRPSSTRKSIGSRPTSKPFNLKRAQLQQDEQRRIEVQNSSLFMKLSRQMQRHSFMEQSCPKSLNSMDRHQRQKRIKTQNQLLFKRIELQKSHYNHSHFQKQFAELLTMSKLRRRTFSGSERFITRQFLRRQSVNTKFQTYKDSLFRIELAECQEKGLLILQQISVKRIFCLTLEKYFFSLLSQLFSSETLLGYFIFWENGFPLFRLQDQQGVHRWQMKQVRLSEQYRGEMEEISLSQLQNSQLKRIYQEQMQQCKLIE